MVSDIVVDLYVLSKPRNGSLLEYREHVDVYFDNVFSVYGTRNTPSYIKMLQDDPVPLDIT